MQYRRWKPILRENVNWPLGKEEKVFWYDEKEPSTIVILYLKSSMLGIVDRRCGALELDEVIYLADLPRHPEWIKNLVV